MARPRSFVPSAKKRKTPFAPLNPAPCVIAAAESGSVLPLLISAPIAAIPSNAKLPIGCGLPPYAAEYCVRKAALVAGSGIANQPPCMPGKSSVAAGMSQRVRPMNCVVACDTPASGNSCVSNGRAEAEGDVMKTAFAPPLSTAALIRGIAATTPSWDNG